MAVLTAGLVGVALVVGAAVWAAADDGDTGPERTEQAAVSGPGEQDLPLWPAPADVPARAQAAGLPIGPMGTAEHYHLHLDVLVDGEPVIVPANLGVDWRNGAMSYLHTHSPDGLVHVEAGEKGQVFTLGQLFTQWDVRLTTTRLGGLKATDGKTLTVYVNGQRVPGDPAQLRLRPHQQIALVFGPAGHEVDVPANYDFPPGV